MALNPSTPERAAHLIRLWSLADLDPTDPNVVDAFIVASKVAKRVHPDRVRKIMKARRVEVVRGTELSNSFYVVPLVNFPGGVVPEEVLPHVKSRDRLHHYIKKKANLSNRAV